MLKKSFLFLAFAMLLANVADAQLCFPAKKIYAWFQPVTRGTAAKGDSKENEARGNYFVYLESKNDAIQLTNAWIKGKVYTASLSPVTSPVILQMNHPNNPLMKAPPVQLVPKTSRKIFKVNFTAAAEPAKKSVPEKLKSKPVVLEVAYKKKTRFITADSLKTLETLGMY